jgi:hypothetical protein
LTGYEHAPEDKDIDDCPCFHVELDAGSSCLKRLIEVSKNKKPSGGFNPMAGLVDAYEQVERGYKTKFTFEMN